ncbi:MAG: hypothetical protein OES57_12775 [Acidimicrobiia bacterium]|nr:hypothetical protein [Acidimicrobiia bacterium]
MPMGAKPGLQQSKQLKRFDQYFGPGEDLANRLDAVVEGIKVDGTDDGHDDKFWSDADNAKLVEKSQDHFFDDWLGGGFFPGIDREHFYKQLRRGVRGAAVAAQKSDPPLPLQIVWVHHDTGTTSTSVGVDPGVAAVTVVVSTTA